jgi:hypothetical protein
MRTHKVEEHRANCTDDDEHQIESPSNICKCRGRSLQVHEVGQRNCRHAETYPLRADVVGEELGIEYYARDIDAHAVDGEEEVEPNHNISQRSWQCRLQGL